MSLFKFTEQYLREEAKKLGFNKKTSDAFVMFVREMEKLSPKCRRETLLYLMSQTNQQIKKETKMKMRVVKS